MRGWLATGALVLAASVAANARIMPTRMDPWHGTVSFHETHEAQIDAYTRAGAFPTAGRSLETKVREVSAFLDREFAKAEQRGVGASAAIVYKDQVRFSMRHVVHIASMARSNAGARDAGAWLGRPEQGLRASKGETATRRNGTR